MQTIKINCLSSWALEKLQHNLGDIPRVVLGSAIIFNYEPLVDDAVIFDGLCGGYEANIQWEYLTHEDRQLLSHNVWSISRPTGE